MSSLQKGDIITAIVKMESGWAVHPYYVRIVEVLDGGNSYNCVDWKNHYIVVSSKDAFHSVEGAWSECKNRTEIAASK